MFWEVQNLRHTILVIRGLNGYPGTHCRAITWGVKLRTGTCENLDKKSIALLVIYRSISLNIRQRCLERRNVCFNFRYSLGILINFHQELSKKKCWKSKESSLMVSAIQARQEIATVQVSRTSSHASDMFCSSFYISFIRVLISYLIFSSS